MVLLFPSTPVYNRNTESPHWLIPNRWVQHQPSSTWVASVGGIESGLSYQLRRGTFFIVRDDVHEHDMSHSPVVWNAQGFRKSCDDCGRFLDSKRKPYRAVQITRRRRRLSSHTCNGRWHGGRLRCLVFAIFFLDLHGTLAQLTNILENFVHFRWRNVRTKQGMYDTRQTGDVSVAWRSA